MAGGVQNLRALFEQNNRNTSSQDRNLEENSANGGEVPPRPLSKVRTSFVTVERSRLLGSKAVSRRDVSNDSSASQNDSNQKDNINLKEFKSHSGNISGHMANVNLSQLAKKQEQAELLKRRMTQKANSMTTQTPMQSGHMNKINPAAAKQISKKLPINSPERTAKTNYTNPQKRLAISSANPISRQIKSNQLGNKLNGGSTASASSKSPIGKFPPSSPKVMTRNKTQTVPPQSRFHKPHPKSPTRPVKLPASLTTHTASSSIKSAAAASTVKTQSNSRLFAKPISLSRPASQMSSAYRASSVVKDEIRKTSPARRISAELKRKHSTQSLGSQSTPAEDKFLARMMRPTTSSKSKVAEKPASPHRQPRSSPRTMTRNGLRDTPSKQEMKKSPLGAHKANKEVNSAHVEIKIKPPKLQQKETLLSSSVLSRIGRPSEDPEPTEIQSIEITGLQPTHSGSVDDKLETKPRIFQGNSTGLDNTTEPNPTFNQGAAEHLAKETEPINLRTEFIEQDNQAIAAGIPPTVLREEDTVKIHHMSTVKTADEIHPENKALEINSLTKDSNTEPVISVLVHHDASNGLNEEKGVESIKSKVQTQQDNPEDLKSSFSKINIKELIISKEQPSVLDSLETSPAELIISESTENRSPSVESPVSPVFEGFTGPQPTTKLLIPSPSHFDTCRSPIAMDSALFRDPEDIKACEEIALLNAQLMKATIKEN